MRQTLSCPVHRNVVNVLRDLLLADDVVLVLVDGCEELKKLEDVLRGVSWRACFMTFRRRQVHR